MGSSHKATITAKDLQRRDQKASTAVILTGAVSGVVGRVLTQPLERLRIMKQIAAENYSSRGIAGGLLYMYRVEGVRGLFRGGVLEAVIGGPGCATEFYCYDLFKSLISQHSHSG